MPNRDAAKPVDLSVTIITLNEQERIAQAIESVQFAQEIIVVDSGSQDQTVEIAKRLGARVFHNPWPGFGQQKNFAHAKARSNWVLNIDADEVIPEDLAEEVCKTIESSPEEVGAYAVARKTFYLGKWIRHGGWYPNFVTRLARRECAKWTEPPIHEQLSTPRYVKTLTHPLHHYTFTGIQDQILTNLRYSRFGFYRLLKDGQRPSLAKLFFKPLWKFIECYLLKRGFLDGLPGLIIAVNAGHSMFLKYAYYFETKLQTSEEVAAAKSSREPVLEQALEQSPYGKVHSDTRL